MKKKFAWTFIAVGAILFLIPSFWYLQNPDMTEMRAIITWWKWYLASFSCLLAGNCIFKG